MISLISLHQSSILSSASYIFRFLHLGIVATRLPLQFFNFQHNWIDLKWRLQKAKTNTINIVSSYVHPYLD